MAVQGRIIRFGLFQIDPAAAELRKDGIRIKLQEQPFQILVRLLECPGNIVTRDDLRNALWPEGTFVDFDHSLNASINKLRDALGDSAANPRFIQTVPKRGYRFIAPVNVAPTHQDPESMMQSEADVPLKRSRSTRLVVAASVVALICAGVGAAVVLRRTATSAPPVVVVSLTTMPGIELEPSFSPDGNFVVYHGRDASSTTSSLFIKSLRSDNPRRLTSGEASDKSPKWSPDGRTIAFVRFTPPADSAH
jgi:DNA-binding winged helix-turn-helix (wHTH) protein